MRRDIRTYVIDRKSRIEKKILESTVFFYHYIRCPHQWTDIPQVGQQVCYETGDIDNRRVVCAKVKRVIRRTDKDYFGKESLSKTQPTPTITDCVEICRVRYRSAPGQGFA